MQIKDQAVIISGGGSGLGAATAKLLASKGAKVAIFDINRTAAEQVAEEINGLAFAVDITEAKATEAAVIAAREKHGVARVCINCAGVAPAQRIVGKQGPMPLEDFSRVIQINLIGTFNLLRLTSADMIAQHPVNECGERGVIINTASVAAFEGQIGQAAYSASKGGVAAMTLPAARELAKFGVRVNAIAPGIFATPMLLGMPEDVQVSLNESVPFPRRLGHPEEYASFALHIIENSYINGTVLRLDGAIRMQAK